MVMMCLSFQRFALSCPRSTFLQRIERIVRSDRSMGFADG
jgi:hypothetical protein